MHKLADAMGADSFDDTLPSEWRNACDRYGDELRSILAQQPAAPGINLERFREAVQGWRDSASNDQADGRISLNEWFVIAGRADRLLALIDASPNAGSDSPIAYMYRVHRKGQKDGRLWGEVDKAEFDRLAAYTNEYYEVERGVLHPATSAEVER